MILVNGGGIIVLILVAYGVAWIKKSPWKQAKQVRATGMWGLRIAGYEPNMAIENLSSNGSCADFWDIEFIALAKQEPRNKLSPQKAQFGQS